MWINKESGAPAWLLSQDGEGVRFVTEAGGRPRLVPSHEFFTEYREPEAGELNDAPAAPARSKPGKAVKASKSRRGGRSRSAGVPVPESPQDAPTASPEALASDSDTEDQGEA